MAALVQTYPQQTATITMLQSRPTPNSVMIPTNQGQMNQQYMGGVPPAPRSPYGAPTGYRGSSAPIQQYAFTSTPNLNHAQAWQPYGQYPNPNQARGHVQNPSYASRAQHSASMTNLQYNQAMGMGHTGSRDDSALLATRNMVSAPRPNSMHLASYSQQSFTAPTTTSNKAAPDRYRRTVNAQQNQHGRSQSTLSVNNNMPAAQLYNGPNTQRSAVPNRPNSFYNVVPGTSADDMQIYVQNEDGKRVRRQSMHSNNSADSSSRPTLQDKSRGSFSSVPGRAGDKNLNTLRVVSNPTRNGSSESVVSSRSSNSRPSSRPSSVS